MIEAITAYGAFEGIEGKAQANAVQTTGFADWISQELAKANGAINGADDNLKKFAVGEPVALHDVMLSMEEAKLQFQLVTQIRNRVLEAYQDVMRMQI
jgi:flagellar hook-basal body complex protein FliE